MSLIDSMLEQCVIMNKVKTSDGEGGTTTVWTEGAQIDAAITLDTTMEARVADKQGVTSVYTITTKRNVSLEYHDVIKRLRDGKVFRVTSDGDDKMSPKVSSLDMAQVTAEKWELTQ